MSEEQARPMVIASCPWDDGSQQHHAEIVSVVLSPSDETGGHVVCSCGAAGPFANDGVSAIELWNGWAHRVREMRLTVVNLSDEERQEIAERIERSSQTMRIVNEPGVRDSVCVLAEKMEERLQANEHKGHWSECTDEYLIRRAVRKLSELSAAVANFHDAVEDPACDAARVQAFAKRVLHEGADVANFVMMLADNVACVAKVVTD